MSFQKVVNDRRAELKLSVDQLARLCDIPYSTLSGISQGLQNNPSISSLMKIAKGLNVPVATLIAEAYPDNDSIDIVN